MRKTQNSLEKRKKIRKQAIFDLIKKNNNLLSRNDLCKETSYSITAVAESVDELIQDNLVFETESSEQRVGRPPVLLAINPDATYYIGIECSSYFINMEVINSLDERIYANNHYLFHPNASDLLTGIRNFLTTFSTLYPEMWMRTSCITLSLPGKLDTENGIGISYVSIPDWKMVNVKEFLEQHFTKKFVFMNNIDSMLIGYRFINHIPEDDSTLYVMIRNGTGIRFYSNHSLLSHYGVVCEFDHARAMNSNRLCTCGKKGCYDSEITTFAIINKLREYSAIHDNEFTRRFQRLENDHEIILEFFNLVKEGNSYAMEIFNDCSFHIANLLSQTLLVSSADTIILSTEMCHVMPLFRQNIEHYLSQNKVLPLPNIEYTLPENNFGALGAAISGYQSNPSILDGV